VLSQNVRYGDDPNGNSVKERTTRFKALLDEYKPDLIGTQEVTFEWLTYLRTLEGYAVVGSSRAGHKSFSEEWSAIMYSTERFVLMDSDTFWLSKTPDKVSAVDNSLCKRICTWAELYDRYTGETVIMANTHLDHGSTDVRVVQANYLLLNLRKRLAERFDNCNEYLTGDFNFTVNSTPYFTITGGKFVDAHKSALEDKSTVGGSYHGYEDHNSEIDFCFYKGKETVLSYEIISKKYVGEMDTEPGFVSDHYGVITVFERKGTQ
jgi:endonuclease/exonuclease/phosphatase family metal-dependent hydrolase